MCFSFICIKSVLEFEDHIVHGTCKFLGFSFIRVRLDNEVRKGRRNKNSMYKNKNLFRKRAMYFAGFCFFKTQHQNIKTRESPNMATWRFSLRIIDFLTTYTRKSRANNFSVWLYLQFFRAVYWSNHPITGFQQIVKRFHWYSRVWTATLVTER